MRSSSSVAYRALGGQYVLTAYVIGTLKIHVGKHANKFVPIYFINFLHYKKE